MSDAKIAAAARASRDRCKLNYGGRGCVRFHRQDIWPRKHADLKGVFAVEHPNGSITPVDLEKDSPTTRRYDR